MSTCCRAVNIVVVMCRYQRLWDARWWVYWCLKTETSQHSEDTNDAVHILHERSSTWTKMALIQCRRHFLRQVKSVSLMKNKKLRDVPSREHAHRICLRC